MGIYLWIGLGSALGGMARHAVSGLIAVRVGETFPWGTVVVNATGSFLIGFILCLVGPDGRAVVSPTTRQFLALGVLGGYTTFSSFSYQTLSLARDGEWLLSGWNVFLSVASCLLAVWLGHVGASALNQSHG